MIRRVRELRDLRLPPADAPASGSAGCGLDRSPTVASARCACSRSRGARLLPPFGRETPRVAS
ncbi:MAG: hypothetical protein LC729_02530 [Acidobacteria bacterium]|nr:hypothetical protein [Acidobacteriota bacterium]